MANDLIIIRGVQGSGKTFLANMIKDALAYRGNNDVVIIEKDMIREQNQTINGIDASSPKYQHEVMRKQERMVASALRNGKTVICSNASFVVWSSIKPLFELSLDILGKEPIIYSSENQFENVHNVKQETVDEYQNKMVSYNQLRTFIDVYKEKRDAEKANM